jgi:diguanylate cyclase (GGDEF)-like protein/PAS domain S-box-containing protein
MIAANRRLAFLAAAMAVYALVFASWLTLRPFGNIGVEAMSDLGMVAPAAVGAGLAFLAAARSAGRVRAAWSFIGAALASWSLAEMTWSTYELFLAQKTPFPSAADVGYLGAVPLMCAGVLLLSSPTRSLARARTVLDAVIIVFAASAIVWHEILLPTYSASDATTLEKVIGGSYPLGDLLLFFGLVIALAHNRRGHAGAVMAVLTAGLALFLVSDLGYAYLGLSGAYSAGSPVDYGWTFGYLLMGYSAALHAEWRPDYATPRDDSRALDAWKQAAPLGVAALMFGQLIFIGSRASLFEDIPSLVLIGIVLAAVLVRQAVVLYDNAGLNRALVAAGETLEAKVRERTQELSRLVSILEATTDLVGTMDVVGGPPYLNRAGRKMLSIGEDEQIGRRSVLDFYPAWAASTIEQRALPSSLENGSWQGETALLTRDGKEIPVSQVILAHRASDGSPQFYSTIARDISERKEFESKLIRLASHDALTDLFNRRRFEEEIGEELARVKRFKSQAAVLFVDLDGFKYLNDSLGHRTGDEVLVQVAQVLRGQLRETDILSRLGSDEFGMLLTQSNAADAESTAARILAAVQDHKMIAHGQVMSVTASAGIAVAPDHGTTVEQLLAHADMAMYQAKEEGNEFRLYSGDSVTEAAFSAQLMWEQRIRQALDEDRFVLFVQPILDLRTGAVQYEALLRMVDEDGQFILPQDFLIVAERTQLIHAIDRWVVRQAIKVIAACEAQGQTLHLEVNLSGRAFADEDLLPLIRQEIKSNGIAASSLIFEITETAAIANINGARQFIEALKSTGCGFALDDFGVGFSSLYYLKHLPVDYLKIDGSFVRNLANDVSDQHLVRSVVELAHGLGKQTIAEFVEDEATLELLRRFGVDYAQGFFVGKPAPIDSTLGVLLSDEAEAA